MPERGTRGDAEAPDDRAWTLSGEAAKLDDGRPVIVTAVDGPWVPFGERVEVVPVARLEQMQAKMWAAESQVGVLRESASRLRILARRAITEPGASGDQARRELGEAIDWMARGDLEADRS